MVKRGRGATCLLQYPARDRASHLRASEGQGCLSTALFQWPPVLTWTMDITTDPSRCRTTEPDMDPSSNSGSDATTVPVSTQATQISTAPEATWPPGTNMDPGAWEDASHLQSPQWQPTIYIFNTQEPWPILYRYSPSHFSSPHVSLSKSWTSLLWYLFLSNCW